MDKAVDDLFACYLSLSTQTLTFALDDPTQVLSHYPPSHLEDLAKQAKSPANRLCGPIFATSDLEAQIIRLEGLGVRLWLAVENQCLGR